MFSLVIDQGNTLAKVYLFDQDECVAQFSSENLTLKALGLFLVYKKFDAAIIAGVKAIDEEIIHFISNMCRTIVLNADTELPIQNAYESPATLGSDRLAAVCGAAKLFPNTPCLSIDAGTCITYDFIDEKQHYLGGAISPGLQMRAKALHTFTAQLPLIHFEQFETNFIGQNTQSSLSNGVGFGLVHEINGFIESYQKKYPTLQVIACGGDAALLFPHLKNNIFVEPNLVAIGLLAILNHHVQKN
jgi:type III pantothenate kinase